MRALIALWHLLLASLHNSTSLMGTTTTGVVFTLIIAAVGLFVVLLIKRRRGGVAQMRKELGTTILEAAAATIAVPTFMWCLLIVVMIPTTAYKDHQELLARIRTLNLEKGKNTNELNNAKARIDKLEAENSVLKPLRQQVDDRERIDRMSQLLAGMSNSGTQVVNRLFNDGGQDAIQQHKQWIRTTLAQLETLKLSACIDEFQNPNRGPTLIFGKGEQIDNLIQLTRERIVALRNCQNYIRTK